MIDFKGEQVEVMELSNRYGIPWSTINNRHKAGYRDDDLVVKRLRPVLFGGESVTLTEISKRSGIPISTIKSRYRQGYRDQELVSAKHGGMDSENAATKLTVEKVREIKTLLISSKLNQTEIAQRYRIDPSHVSDIRRGKRWAKVKVTVEEVLG